MLSVTAGVPCLFGERMYCMYSQYTLSMWDVSQ